MQYLFFMTKNFHWCQSSVHSFTADSLALQTQTTASVLMVEIPLQMEDRNC